MKWLKKISSWSYGSGIFRVIFNFGLMFSAYSILDIFFNGFNQNVGLLILGAIMVMISVFITEKSKNK